MSDADSNKRLDALRDFVALLGAPEDSALSDILREIDVENMRLGAFLKGYVGAPASVDLPSRSSIREDSVVEELSAILDSSDGEIRVVDVCCGDGLLAERILSGIDPRAARVRFWAIDREPSCIEVLRTKSKKFAGFLEFTPLLRDVGDLRDLERGSIDLVILNNALHEISPGSFPQLFSVLNDLIRPEGGCVCVVDMEELPQDAPEAMAINWHGKEVEEILTAGGMPVSMTRHQKSVMVYRARARQRQEGIAQNDMLATIVRLLKKKRRAALDRLRDATAAVRSRSSGFEEWIIAAGQVARLTQEFDAIESREITDQ